MPKTIKMKNWRRRIVSQRSCCWSSTTSSSLLCQFSKWRQERSSPLVVSESQVQFSRLLSLLVVLLLMRLLLWSSFSAPSQTEPLVGGWVWVDKRQVLLRFHLCAYLLSNGSSHVVVSWELWDRERRNFRAFILAFDDGWKDIFIAFVLPINDKMVNKGRWEGGRVSLLYVHSTS